MKVFELFGHKLEKKVVKFNFVFIFVSNLNRMKKHYRIFGAILGFFVGLLAIAQPQNAMDFDGTDDYITAPSATSTVAGAQQMSVSCWVNPQFTTHHEGFCGFRNNSNADFYLLKLQGTTNIEARFRNSNGTDYTIAAQNVLTAGTWTHLAMTYDGSRLRFYKNGVCTDSITATGTISTAATSDFYVGGVPWGTTYFHAMGQIDEVTLWNRAITTQEVNCMMRAPVDTASAGLQLYYQFNQGVASGTNSSILMATDSKGNIDGVLNNFALSSTSSNFVTGVTNFTPVTANICPGNSYAVGNRSFSTAGNYIVRIAGRDGCDSVVVLKLTVTDTAVINNGPALKARQDSATYQWVKCNQGFAPISGATTQSYLPPVSGVYACIVTYKGCTDTSGCRIYNRLGAGNLNWSQAVVVYPNPTHDQLNVEVTLTQGQFNYQITDLNGRVTKVGKGIANQREVISMNELQKGIYLLKITSNGEQATLKVVKQ